MFRVRRYPGFPRADGDSDGCDSGGVYAGGPDLGDHFCCSSSTFGGVRRSQSCNGTAGGGAEKSEAIPSPLPAPALTLDQAINLCLTNDPKIRVGLEAINQAHADALTASLRPNPEMSVGGTLLPLSRPITPQQPGGPSEFDLEMGYPIDWFLFGKRAAAMASASMGVRVSQADYADLIRQRVTEAALAFYDVLEAQALLDVARQDVENLERVEAVTRKAVENGGRPQVELNRIRLCFSAAAVLGEMRNRR